MNFCDTNSNNGGMPSFQSSALNSGGQDPDTLNWGSQRLNLSVADVQQTIQEGRMMGTGTWNVDGNPQFADSGLNQ